jgi:hypothetical protein
MGDQENDNRKEAGIFLVHVTSNDVPALVKVHTAAFKSDQFSNLMLLNRDENAHQTLMHRSIE